MHVYDRQWFHRHMYVGMLGILNVIHKNYITPGNFRKLIRGIIKQLNDCKRNLKRIMKNRPQTKCDIINRRIADSLQFPAVKYGLRSVCVFPCHEAGSSFQFFYYETAASSFSFPIMNHLANSSVFPS
jgi:hypothetical protein